MRHWFTALVVLAAIPVAGMATFDHMLGAPSGSAKKELVVIKPGWGVSAAADQLQAQGLVRNADAFKLWLRVRGKDRSIKAGIYALAPNMGAKGIASFLVEGRGENERVTVPEGYSMRQIAALLEEKQAGSGARFLAAASDATPYRGEFAWLKALPEGASLEGFLFPDTYVVAPAPGYEADLVRMMLTRFDQVVTPAYDDRPDPAGLKLFEAVTLASIVEKEARHAQERPTIAGVFYNRLATGMPFGSDPTVEYALRKHQGANGLSLRDVAVDSPYNTYKHAGLPPGPIANPGLASVQAVLAPDKTPYLYFVARGDGTHAFTRTYAEHLATQRAIWAARTR
jgi:UPF0755 protein